jgi:magnesium-transporting ATPase (P-type)
MRRGPLRIDSLFSRHGWAALGLIGVLVGVAATAAYVAGREVAPEAAQTMAFATVALAELTLVWSIRSPLQPAWRGPRNAPLVASVLLSAAIVAAVVYVPQVADACGTVALAPVELAVVLALSFVPAAVVEVAKAIRRRAAHERR